MSKQILSLDFDGVIHRYDSGWQGPRVIPDPPVQGALKFIVEALDHFQVAIHSSRSRYWFGRRAMKRWLHWHLCRIAMPFEATPQWWRERIPAFADPWEEEVDRAATAVVREISWPLYKPPAVMSIDDRGFMFEGVFPPIENIKSFKPWNRRG